jgi:A/G-specific adenine glycosylase
LTLHPSTVRALRRDLLGWYDLARRDLPWRAPQGKADPYRAWIAEVMLQQTQVATAIPYWRRFVERFPTLGSLAAAREEDVLAAWSGLGYYARARRLLPAAREAIARHGGLPRTVEALRALPGFGPYTAGAVSSIAFGVRAPAVDGNAARVLARIFLVRGAPTSPVHRRRVLDLAEALVPPGRPGDFNQALMELGATLCRRPAPSCTRCPVAARCRARAAGRTADVPPPRRRAARRSLLVACAVEPGSARILLVRRPPTGLWGGLWDLPGCEVPPGEDPTRALGRVLRRRLGRAVSVGRTVAEVNRALTHRDLTLRAFACRLPRMAGPGIRLATPSEMERLGVPAATRALLVAAHGAGQGAPSPRESLTGGGRSV